jgi:hypothetical protein
LTTENNTNIGNKKAEKEKHSVYQDAIEEVIEYKNLMLLNENHL